MGAIAGILSAQSQDEKRTEASLELMMRELQHRGPLTGTHRLGSQGAFGAGFLARGEARRVMARDREHGLCVVLDGEIFAGPDGTDSGSAGFSDAETVLGLYRKHGAGFVDFIDGAYAMALWDGGEQRLLLVRDRVGYIPLFYLKAGDRLVFASEIKGILQSGYGDKTVNLNSLNRFLSYGYVPGPETFFESIRQVKSGHMLIFNRGEVTEQPYWAFSYAQGRQRMPDEYYVERFLEIFKRAVERRTRRHTECGAFLSGGLDTSAVVAVMHELNGRPFKAFTGGFEEERYNEFEDARVVAEHLGLEHLGVTIGFSHDFPDLLQKIVWHHDSPFADTSAIPSYHTARFAREHVGVVLTGDFPDQVLGGSGHHAKALALESSESLIHRLLSTKRIGNVVCRIPWKAGGTSTFDRFKRMLYRASFPIEEQRIILDMPVPELLKRCLYSQDLLSVNKAYDPILLARSMYEEVADHDLLDKLLYFDTLSYAPDDLMVKVERMTMAHGLVALSPFHDRELVEFMATLPPDMKIRGETRKYILREAVRPLLPAYTLEKKKKGFDMPIGEWMIRKFPDYVREILFDDRTMNRGYFDKKFLRKMVEGFLGGKSDYASGSEGTMISLITLELWHRVFIDS